jgi:hypothetical protein
MIVPLGGCRPGASTSPLPLALPVAALVLAVALAGCGQRVTLEHTLDSPTAVARAVLDALNRRDVAALERFSVTEDEFRRLVWPKQPAARPGRNIPWDYVWRDLAGKSRIQVRARAREWPVERGFTLVEVGFRGDTTDYEAYRIFRESQVTLRDRDGALTRTRMFGALIEQRGRFKVFSYVVD